HGRSVVRGVKGRKQEPLPLQLPQPDGSNWPDRSAVGRMSFEVSTLYEMGYREAFEPAAHAIAELLMDEVLPVIPLVGVPEQDASYLRRVFMVAAQVGAGIGLVEARSLQPAQWCSDRRIWGALWKAMDDLPRLHDQQRPVATFMMHSGYYLARTGVGALDQLLAVLRDGPDPALS
ncbi:MAG: hypothetical protein ABWZ98_14275, partial [Nakamurella sp.]